MTTKSPKPNEPLRGFILNPAVAIEQQYTASILALIRRMAEETKKTLLGVFAEAAHDAAMDAGEREGAIEGHANVSSQARIAINQLVEKYEPLFARVAKKATKRMMDRTIQNSRVTLGASLREISASVSLDAKSMSPALLDVITASTNEAVGLIKIIPTTYLQKVQGAVMRSITTGNGLKDLAPFLEKAYGQNIRHARNVAMDQTRKSYGNVTAQRMKDIGQQTYEWIHTGGSKEPRLDHIALHGKVFRFDDPPVIDAKTGQRGKPGDAIFCRCRMRPVISFESND